MTELNDLFTGTPPTYGVNVVGGGRSPFYGGAKTFSDYLTGLIGQPTPSYGGKIDPGMSPTLAALGQMMQAYSTAGQPGIMGQSEGVLGRFMNPSFANPIGRMQMGFPQYFGAGGPSSMNGGGFMGGPPGGGGMTNPFQGGQNPFGPPPSLGGDPMGGMSVSPMPPGPSSPGSINGGGFMAPGGNMVNAAMPISNKQVAVDGSSYIPPGMRNAAMPLGGWQDPGFPPGPPGRVLPSGPTFGGGMPPTIPWGQPPESFNRPTPPGGWQDPGFSIPPPSGGRGNGGMTAGIAQEIPFSMAGRTPQPPPLRPGQMTRQQWIDAGMKPAPKNLKVATPDKPKGGIKNIKSPVKGDKLTKAERRKKIFKR